MAKYIDTQSVKCCKANQWRSVSDTNVYDCRKYNITCILNRLSFVLKEVPSSLL